MGLSMNHRLLLEFWYKRIPSPKPWCQLKNTQQRIVSYREPPNEMNEMETHTHMHETERDLLDACPALGVLP
jgi:hypothetical protein